jgi:ribosomal protein L11 methyltransferase
VEERRMPLRLSASLRGGLLHQEVAGVDRWVTLTLRPPEPVRDAIINFLIEETSRGVRLEGEGVTAYCRPGPEAEICLRRLRGYYLALQELHPELPELELVVESCVEEDWAEAWKKFFKPLRLGRAIVVKPSWESWQGGEGQIVVEIDPGRAFGTGNHPSTGLCIEILEELLWQFAQEGEEGPRVLDVGTGTGILGIVAAKLGASRVLGLDIDPVALQIAAANVERNRVGGIMTVSGTPVGQVAEEFQVVVANLAADPLISHASSLSERVGRGGWLVLSGILEDQVEAVMGCFSAHELTAVETRAGKEWRTLLFRK